MTATPGPARERSRLQGRRARARGSRPDRAARRGGPPRRTARSCSSTAAGRAVDRLLKALAASSRASSTAAARPRPRRWSVVEMVLSGTLEQGARRGAHGRGRARDRHLGARRRARCARGSRRTSGAWARPSASIRRRSARSGARAFCPVVSPVANGPLGEAVNVNADEAALGIARAVGRDDARLPLRRGRRAARRARGRDARRPRRRARGSTTARSRAGWRSRCASRSRPRPPGIPEVVIAGKARLRGSSPARASWRPTRDQQRSPAASESQTRVHEGTVTTALLPIYERDLVLVKGKGSRLWDKDGREWLDFAAGIAVNGFGYGDRKIVAAIKKQAETADAHEQPVPHRARERPRRAPGQARLPLEGVLHATRAPRRSRAR